MFSGVSSVALVALFLLIISDVIGRNVFNSPIQGTIEISEYLVVIIAFLALGHAQIEGRHVRILILVSRLSRRLQATIGIFVLLLSMSLFTITSWTIAQTTYKVWVSKVVHWGMNISLPTWLPYLAALIGFSLLVISLLIGIVRYVIRPNNKPGDWRL